MSGFYFLKYFLEQAFFPVCNFFIMFRSFDLLSKKENYQNKSNNNQIKNSRVSQIYVL
jgi:hypothetical protein